MRVPTVMLGGMLFVSIVGKLGENNQKMPKLGIGKLYFRGIVPLTRK